MPILRIRFFKLQNCCAMFIYCIHIYYVILVVNLQYKKITETSNSIK